MRLLKSDHLALLVELGLTKTQAKLYLTLLNYAKTDVRTLSKDLDTPRQEIYRALGELQEKGFVSKIVASPLKYQAIPISELLSVIISSKTTEHEKLLEQAEYMIKAFEENKLNELTEQDIEISIVEGKETIIKRCKSAHAKVQETVCCCSTFERWIHIGSQIHETIQRALSRGVKYRIVVEKPAGKINLPKEVELLIENNDFQVRMTEKKLKVNAVIFDSNLTGFSLYLSRPVAETPMIWTNHPSILASFKEHFDRIWVENATSIERLLKP